MKGMRQAKSVKSTKDRLKDLEDTNRQLQMSIQMSQMMVKHLTNQLSALQTDVGGVMGMSNDFQYRTLSMLELGDFDKDAVNAKAEEFKLADFVKASDKEDLDKGYEVDDAGIVTEESIVIISSSTPDTDEDQGIFRSKFSMAECNTPDLREKLLGSKVGDQIETNIQGTKHVIDVLGLRFKRDLGEEAEEVLADAERIQKEIKDNDQDVKNMLAAGIGAISKKDNTKK